MNIVAGFVKSRLTLGTGIRFLIVSFASATTALGVLYANYYNYWEVTIRRTQTVDFNILANLLPTKISLLLPQAQTSKASATLLQQSLDSNYGLFGIIVTDCKSAEILCSPQRILFASQAKISNAGALIPQNEYAKNWVKRIETRESLDRELASSPHVLLYNPPPLQQEWSFLSPRDDTQVPQQKNQGTIIGRIYFLRADPPTFENELARWRQDIPKSLASMSSDAKSRISSRTLVYNSVAFSALLTGLMAFLILEFAYYLMRLSQEKESRAVTEKLSAEQKLRATQSRLRQAQEKIEAAQKQAELAAKKSENALLRQQESEQKAREAAIEYELALREKEQAEAAAEDISQQLLQQREFADQAIRLATEKSEQALREKAEAEERAQQAATDSVLAQRQKAESEELLRIALQENEQALSDKAKAEEQARLAAEEREHARNSERDLYEKIEDEIERKTRELSECIETLQAENQRLQREHHRQLTKAESVIPGQNAIYFEMIECDLYPSERKDLILEIIKRGSASVHGDSRSDHVLKDLLEHNQPSGHREFLKQEIDNLFKGYRAMEKPLRSKLQHLGFEFISDNHHHKIRFHSDPRYTVSFAKTPSDWRAGKNISDDICHRIL